MINFRKDMSRYELSLFINQIKTEHHNLENKILVIYSFRQSLFFNVKCATIDTVCLEGEIQISLSSVYFLLVQRLEYLKIELDLSDCLVGKVLRAGLILQS